MKKIYLSIFLAVILAVSSFCQVPDAINYQSVVRDQNGNILPNQPVNFRISILQGGPNGAIVYREIQEKITSQIGLVTLEIGRGTPDMGDFPSINWDSGNYYLQTEMDATGGMNFQSMGSSELLSVPYALFSKNSNVTGWSLRGNSGTNPANDFVGTKDSTGLAFRTNNNERMRIAPQGNVGIGTASPDNSALLQVSSTTQGFLVPRMSSAQKSGISQPAKGLLIFQTDGVSGFYYNHGTSGSPNWTLLAPSTSTLWVQSAPGTSLILGNPSDSVGIGRSMPVEKLNVNGNLALDNFQPMILFREDTLESAIIQHISPQSVGYLHLHTWDGNHFETTGLVVKSPAQNVGIGTTFPFYKLDVAGTARMSGFILSSATDSGYVLTSDKDGIGTWKPAASHLAGNGTKNYLAKFLAADSLSNSVVYQSTDGNVGIGTTSPQQKLDVNGLLNMRNNIALGGNWLSADGGDEGVFVNDAGKVGIGTTSLTSLLTSAGVIETKSGGVKFPDGTLQNTAASNVSSTQPKDAALSRWAIGMEIPGLQGSWDSIDNCPYCSRVFDLFWYGINKYDTMTGMPVFNSAQHHVITVMKDIDKMSIGLVTALHQISGQSALEHVIFHFYDGYTSVGKSQQVNAHEYFKITLENASVVYFSDDMEYKGNDKFAHMEKVSFTYESIRWDYISPGQNYQSPWSHSK
jgi:type VI secretion system Hcp family effector